MAANEKPGPEPVNGLADFWRVFEARYDELLRDVSAHAAERGARPSVQALFDPSGQNLRQAIRAAVEGDWQRYYTHVRQAAGQSESEGATLSDWYRLARTLESRLLRLVVEAYRSDEERLVAALEAKRRFFHRTVLIIGETLLRRSEGALEREKAVAEQVSEDLARSEARKNSIVDAALDAIITIDYDGRIIEFNPAAERIFGYSRADALGTGVTELIIPERYREAHRAGLRRALQGQPPRILGRRVELPARRAAGDEILVELSVVRLPATDPPAFSAFIHDITEQRAARDALRASEARQRQLFDKSPLPTWVADRTTMRFLEVNEAAIEHYGYSREEFMRMTVADIRPPEEVPALMERFGRQEGTVVARSVHRKKNGEHMVVDVVGHPIDHEGHPARLVVANDVTERQRSEERLRWSEARFARLYAAGIVGIAVSDLNGAILEANECFLRMLGFSQDDLAAGRLRWSELTPLEWQRADEAARGDLLARGVVEPYEKEYLRRDGSRAPVMIGAAHLDGTRYLTFVLDISERKRLDQARRDADQLQEENRRIVEASRLKSEFLANMSHELRTPLNAIIGFSELMYDEEVARPQAREYLFEVLASARHLLSLINDVLDLTKVEAGRLEFRPEEISCAEVAKGTVNVLRALVAAKQMNLSVSVDPSLGAVFLDPARLKQVLYNFLSNALKFTPPGGRVELRLLPEGEDSFRIEVEDNGPGIAEADMKRLFVQFQQLHGGYTRPHEGAGLGLALTRRLVEAQGGTVGVRSELGRGSVFHAVLPRRARQSAR